MSYYVTKVRNNQQGSSPSWVLPPVEWVFQIDTSEGKVSVEGLADQLDLGFAFTSPLDITVVKDGKPAKKNAKPEANVQGAPPGHHAIETGAPPGQHPAAAQPAVQPQAKAKAAAAPKATRGRGRGGGRGRGRGASGPAAASNSGQAAHAEHPSAEAAAAPAAEVPAAAAATAARPVPGEQATKRRRISVPPGIKLGCSKCNRCEVGCTTCRPKAGLIESSEKKGMWILKS